MSRPRAATSVATRIRARPALNASSAFCRCAWLLLPWMATAGRPDFSSCSAKRLQPCLVLPNTSTWSVWRADRMSTSRSRLLAESTGCARWTMVSAMVFCAATSTCFGDCMYSNASALMRASNVAENSSVCRCFGTRPMIRFICGRKPMSSMRSASSSTRTSTASSLAWPASMWSSRRPGQATRMSTPRRRLSICGCMPAPPKMVVTFMRRWRPYSLRLSATCTASSRVGTSTRARGLRGPLGWVSFDRRCSIGRPKAAVLPVPVWAAPSTSWPARTSGIACAWIGVGTV